MKGSYQGLYEFGAMFLGPILSVYAREVEKQAGDRLPVCLAREGWLFHKLLTELQREELIALCEKPVYLKVSRTVLMRSLLGDPSSWPLAFSSEFQGSVLHLLMRRFALQLHEAFTTLPQELLNFNVKLPEQANVLIKWLTPHLDRLHKVAEPTKRGVQSSLERAGLASPKKKPMMLDIGYSGTIQKLLTVHLQKDTFGLYFVSVKAGEHKIGQHTAKMRGVFREDVAWNEKYPLLDRSLLLESLMTAPHGQVIDVREETDGKIVYFYGRQTASQRHYQDLDVIFCGAINEVKRLFRKQIFYSIDEVESLYSVFSGTRGAIPKQVWHLFGIDDEFSGNGIMNPLEFFGL